MKRGSNSAKKSGVGTGKKLLQSINNGVEKRLL